MVVNAEFHFLICQLCKEGISTSTARAHIANKHPDLLYAFKQDQFDQAVKEMALVFNLPDNISGPRPVIHGLAICDALACNQCPTVLGSVKKMKDHCRHHHQDLPIPKTFRACKAQRMKAEGAGKQRTFWEVTMPESIQDSPQADMVKKLMKELDKQLEVVQVVTDSRLISPWLLTTRWNEHVANMGETIEQQRNLVSLSRANMQENCCRHLPQLVECYFQEALQLIDTTDELVLQRLNSPDPIRKYVHKFLHSWLVI